jgi:uncharacterized protein YllA (UPF0747 family)
MLNKRKYYIIMESIYENFDISLGIKKNKKFITIKNTQKVQDLEKDEEKLKIKYLEEILQKHKENTEKLKKENEKLEKQIKELNKNVENEKKLLIKQNKIIEKKNKIIVNTCNKNTKQRLEIWFQCWFSTFCHICSPRYSVATLN